MRRNAAGFTLIELVLALGIFGIVMGVAYSALTSITESKQALDDQRDLGLMADAVLSRMTRELQLAFAGIPLMPPPESTEERYPARICLVGESDRLSNGEAGDKITFLALEGGQYMPDGGAHSGIVQVSYRVEPDPEQASSRDSTHYLVRQEVPYTRPFNKAYEKAMVFPITKNLVSLKFRYMKREEDAWTSVWGKDALANLPRLVYFELQLKSPRGDIQTFATTVPLRSKP